MKKTLSLLAIIGSASLMAQQPSSASSEVANQAVKMKKQAYTGFENHQYTPYRQTKAGAPSLEQVGNSFYDLQSNASIDDRIHYDASTGTVNAAWTFSANPSFTDRGSGYNNYDGTQWGTLPSARVDNERTGWPSLVITDTSEFIVAHGSDYLVSSIRGTAGSGNWSSAQMSFITDGALWPRATNGGADNKTVHVIAISTPTGNGGTIQNGIDGILLYYRSLDGGYTWDIQDSILPHQDSALHFGFGGDSYAIDANGNTVAIAVFNDYEDSFILKSTDNGDTWTKTIFLDGPLDDYSTAAAGSISDINNDAIADTITGTDNAGSIIVDGSGNVHVTWGMMRYLDDDPTLDEPGSYFPATNGLMYWNESSPVMGGTLIAGALDLDNDGFISISATSEIPLYYTSLAGQPSMGLDANDNIFVIYTMLNELEFNGVQFYHNLYRVSSRDGGATWSSPKDLTPNRPFAECVFGSLAREVDDYLRIIYMEDGEPGLAVRGDEDPVSQNDIIYLEIDTAATEFVSISEMGVEKGTLSDIYPNPAQDKAFMDFTVNHAGNYSIEITSITGAMVKSINLGELNEGNFRKSFDLTDVSNGVYVVTLKSTAYTSSKRLVVRK